MARSVVRGINAMAGSESGVAGHAMATLRGAAPAMTQQALAASTSSCPPGSKIRNAHLMWLDEVKMKLRRRARFRWEKSPKTVLFVKKVGDREVSARSREMAEWLLRRGLQVYVEPEAKATGDFPGDCEPWNPQDDTVSLVERRARRDHRTESNRTPLSLSLSLNLSIHAFCCRSQVDIDFGVVAGGDGTLLHFANLLGENEYYRSGRNDVRPLPPCVSFG